MKMCILLRYAGFHDKAMGGSNDMKERVKMLEEALNGPTATFSGCFKKPAN